MFGKLSFLAFWFFSGIALAQSARVLYPAELTCGCFQPPSHTFILREVDGTVLIGIKTRFIASYDFKRKGLILSGIRRLGNSWYPACVSFPRGHALPTVPSEDVVIHVASFVRNQGKQLQSFAIGQCQPLEVPEGSGSHSTKYGVVFDPASEIVELAPSPDNDNL